MSAARWTRTFHRKGAMLIALPLIVIIGSGILLQLKKQSDWIQPPTKSGVGTAPAVGFEAILEAARSVPEAQVQTWDDIERLDVRPSKGVVKVRAKNGWEVQVDTQTGTVLQSAVRRSDVIESIHDGSFIHDGVKLWGFLPVAVILAALWVTGVYLFFLPRKRRKEGRRRKARLAEARARTEE